MNILEKTARVCFFRRTRGREGRLGSTWSFVPRTKKKRQYRSLSLFREHGQAGGLGLTRASVPRAIDKKQYLVSRRSLLGKCRSSFFPRETWGTRRTRPAPNAINRRQYFVSRNSFLKMPKFVFGRRNMGSQVDLVRSGKSSRAQSTKNESFPEPALEKQPGFRLFHE